MVDLRPEAYLNDTASDIKVTITNVLLPAKTLFEEFSGPLNATRKTGANGKGKMIIY